MAVVERTAASSSAEDQGSNVFAQLTVELSRLEGLIRAYWARQRESSQTGSLADLPLARLFPDEPDELVAAMGNGAAPLDPYAVGPQMPHLLQLADSFQLDAFALDALLVILAPSLDGRYGRVYGFLQDDLTLQHATVELVLALLGPAGLERLRYLHHFSERGPLVQHQLIHVEESDAPLLRHGLLPDPTLVAWLLGEYRPVPQWSHAFSLSIPEFDATDNALTYALWPELVEAMHGQNLACLFGEDSIGQQAMVRKMAVSMEVPLLTVDVAGLLAAGCKSTLILRLALRDAAFTGALLHLEGFDALLSNGVLPPILLEALLAYHGLVVTTGKIRWQPQGLLREEAILWQSFDPPTFSQRRRLWNYFLEQIEPNHTLDTEALAGRFRLSGWQIRDVIAGARDQALRVGREQVSEEDLNTAIRAHSQTRLVDLATHIVPRYSWQDLVLPAAQIEVLQAIVNMVKHRALVLEDWGIGRKLLPSPAVSVLFSGDPGTGKTMAAEVLASQLGLDLYKIDLSSMVSKYIGETEKNLEAIFNEAERSNAILFFDEADAVFGKRSGIRDAHDRYANIGVSYLLQRMESHEGVTILATNLRSNLDEAFTRRLQFVVDFPFPEVAERLRIWQALIPKRLPLAADVELDQLAHRYKLAGGNIRNIIVSASFMAAEQGSEVTMELLVEAVRREFQKMGRLASEGELRLGGAAPEVKNRMQPLVRP